MIARPVLFVLWAYLLWGTVYGAALAFAAATEGPDALGRIFHGGDPLLGIVSFIAAVLAAVVWSVLGVFAILNRTRRGTSAAD